MSPVQAMERSYVALKQMLRVGAFVPGARLEANRLADDIGVSMTPVRDALHRLAGEGLVEAHSGDGFRVPRMSEGALRALYEWNSAIVSMALRSTPHDRVIAAVRDTLAMAAGADRTAELFDRIASTAPNEELCNAILAANDRLHAFRKLEDQVLEPIATELADMVGAEPSQPQSIRRYHLRRMRAASQLVRVRERT